MISRYRLFILIFIPAALVLAAGIILIQQKNSELSSTQFEAQIKSQWRLAALVADNPAYQSKLIRINENHGLRITLIGQHGQVISDSAASGALESHKDRAEIKSALAGTPAMLVRYSTTTNSHTIYYAEKLPDGRVLRVAYPAAYFDALTGSLLSQAFIGLIVLIASVAIFAFIISKKMSHTLSTLSAAVEEAQTGGHDLPSFNNKDLDQALFALSAATRSLKLSSADNYNLRQRLEYILANIDEGVLMLAEDEIIYHNQQAGEILNFKIPAQMTNICAQEMLDVFAGFKNGLTGELRLGGQTIIVSQTISEAGRLILLHDVSDREKYSDYKSDLVGNISHELKTPLTLIMGAAEVILKDKEISRDYLDKFLNTIYRNSHRLNLLLDDLIFLHQLESGPETTPEEADLAEIIADLKELMGPITKTVNYKISSGTCKIHAAHVISVLTNLISNADKYSHGESIEVSVVKNSKTLEIQVADFGPIIPKSNFERIFERFYTVSKSRNRGASGSGLGLSIVKHIAKIYKGRAWLEHNNSGGNTFLVHLVERG